MFTRPHLGALEARRARHAVAGAKRALTAAACALGVGAVACKGPKVGAMEAVGPDPLVQKSNVATVGWRVDPDDHVRVAVAGPDGQPLAKPVTGTLVYKGRDGAPKTVVLAPDADGPVLVAAGPKLDPGLTEVDYTFQVDGRPLSGTLYLPPQGTAPLVVQASAPSPVVEGKVGPHGGMVEVVGDDRLEVASTKGGDVRAYVLDADLHPVVVGPRRVVLGVVADRPETVVLEPDRSGLYLVGHWHLHGAPVHMTVSETVGAEAHVAVIGAPGVIVAVGAVVPPLPVVVVDRWEAEPVIGVQGGIFIGGPSIEIGPRLEIDGRHHEDWDDDHDHRGGGGHINIHENIHIKGGGGGKGR